MIEDRIELIQSTIEAARNIPGTTKADLLEQVATLRSEIKALAESHPEEASSITHFAGAAAHEASRSRRNPQLAEAALHGLSASIQELEETHPVLVGMVNRFATALSNMGL